MPHEALSAFYKTTRGMIHGGLNPIEIQFTKEFQIMKCPSKVDNLITTKVGMYKMWAITFECK